MAFYTACRPFCDQYRLWPFCDGWRLWPFCGKTCLWPFCDQSRLWPQVCREADGFQRSLVSPEAGLRRLVHDSVETVLIPVDMTVRRVHQVLIDASR